MPNASLRITFVAKYFLPYSVLVWLNLIDLFTINPSLMNWFVHQGICLSFYNTEWLVGQQKDLAKGFHHLYKAENNFIFYLYAPKHPAQVVGILDDKITSYSSPLYDGGRLPF